MRRLPSFLPAIFWMAVIFYASTEAGAPRTTSRILGPLIRWLAPNLSEETVAAIVFGIRKCAHAVEYALLAWLIYAGRHRWKFRPLPAWNWREAAIVVGWSAVYAASDEFHQLFVSSRGASVWDVLLDTAGACAGMLLFWMWFRVASKFVRRTTAGPQATQAL